MSVVLLFLCGVDLFKNGLTFLVFPGLPSLPRLPLLPRLPPVTSHLYWCVYQVVFVFVFVFASSPSPEQEQELPGRDLLQGAKNMAWCPH
jgi:hypothetical protein